MVDEPHLNESTIEKVNYYTRKLSQAFFDEYQGFFESYSDRKKIQHKIKNNLLVSIKELMTEGYKEDLIGYIIYKSIECFTKERIDLEL